ncbi:uncharacterized protein LOC119914867 [Micropterus salmoides]|uniref:uncharacterized protein LOC119914867 n=1 Tax=Micropterus salmoides TaxID=27706 RepID=UPI0018ED072A|nr:uncharacterized protein LOC119914867 [Micropterus salmoides]
MASEPRRKRFSKDLPPDLSELMNKLIQHATSFIRGFDISKQRRTEIVGEFQNITAEVRKMQKITQYKIFTGIIFVISMILKLSLVGGGRGAVAAVAAVGAISVAIAVSAANKKKTTENKSAEKVLNLGGEFLEIVEPLKNELEEIKRTCERLEEESAAFQAENTLSHMEEFQRILRQVAQLNQESQEAVDVAVLVMGVMGKLVMLIRNVFTIFAEENRKLTASILQSADQCQKVSDQFDQMKNELSAFPGQ